jgi:hypothetical protein
MQFPKQGTDDDVNSQVLKWTKIFNVQEMYPL